MEAVECISTTESVYAFVFGASFLHVLVFIQKTFFDLLLLFFCLFIFIFRNGKKRGQVRGEVILVLAGLTSERKKSEDKTTCPF